MNEHILVAMDWKNRSKEELEKNYDAAAAVAYYAAATAAADAAALDDALDAHDVAAAYAAYDVAADAHAVATAAATAATNIEYWVNEYFEITGEDREEYEKALEDMRK